MKKIEILMRNWSFSYLSNHDLIIFVSIQFCSVKKSDSSVEHFLNYWTTLFMGESSIVDSRESCTSIPQFWYLGIEVTDQNPFWNFKISLCPWIYNNILSSLNPKIDSKGKHI